MKKLEKLREKYRRIKEHIYESYKAMDKTEKEELVQLLIANVFDKKEYEEYKELCDKLFNS